VAGPRRAVVIQAGHRYKYDRCPEAVGARLRVAGDGDGTTPDQLAAALDGTAAAVLVPAHLDRLPGVVPLDGVIEIARRAGVPVLVDAAFHVYPLARMTGYLRAGTDLVAFAAKYFQGPQSAGLLCGRRDLIAAAALQGFIGFETADTRSIGRAMKLDRQEVAATVVALEDWLALDHEARIDGYRRRLQAVAAPLADLPGVALAFEERDDTEVVVLRVGVAPAGDRTAAAVQAALRAGDPAVWVDRDGDDLIVAMPTVHPGDEAIVADRLRAALSGR
jgi:L-seryl-tRNA(Ser) seleniumtransferase